MRKLLSVAIVLIAATVFFWSKSVPLSPHVMTASAVSIGKAAGPVEGMPAISPFEIMVTNGKSLPSESWDAH